MATQESKLAGFLKDCRLKSGLSQKEVSSVLGYETAQFVSNWERGVSSPPISILWKLAGLYKVSAQKLFDVVLEEELRLTAINLKTRFKQAKSS